MVDTIVQEGGSVRRVVTSMSQLNNTYNNFLNNESTLPVRDASEPWLEEDHLVDTQRFVKEVESKIVDFMVLHTGRDKLARSDAVSSEQKFVDPFVCTICQHVAQEAVQCATCKQIFDRKCIDQWLEGNINCSKCQNRFEIEELNPNLVQMFDQIRFICKYCKKEFRFQQRRTHLMTCSAIQITGCAFGCTNVATKMMDHINNECDKQPLCGACDFAIYKKYHELSNPEGLEGIDSAILRGHNCIRDNSQSDKLMITLRMLQRKAKQSVNSQLEASEAELRRQLQVVQDELVLYKGPIPDHCKPTLNDMNLFECVREENTEPGMAIRCKQWIIESILTKGFTDDAMIQMIQNLQESYGSHWRVMILTRRQQDAIASQAACSGVTVVYKFTKRDFEFIIQIQEMK